MEEVIVGVVGTLQFDVFQYRMRNEYGVELVMTSLPYEHLRFILSGPSDPKELTLSVGADVLEDFRGHKVLVFGGIWSLDYMLKKNPKLELAESLSV